MSWLGSVGSALQTGFGDLTSGLSGVSNDISNVLGQNGTLTIGGTTIHTGTQPVTSTLRGNSYPTTAAGAASIFGGLGSSVGSLFSSPIGILIILVLIIAVA